MTNHDADGGLTVSNRIRLKFDDYLNLGHTLNLGVDGLDEGLVTRLAGLGNHILASGCTSGTISVGKVVYDKLDDLRLPSLLLNGKCVSEIA